ncbi:MAG: CoA transferase [Alphaproteobacteria bacterium]|nr:CoA transferase [Alphaproteobacteria bacterium]
MAHVNPPPLAGIRVLDLTWNLPGPYASFQLASLGAEVTKIEPPRGDPAKHVPGLYEPLNRGKHVIVLDLREEGDRRRLEDLIRETDVVLEGFRPGVAERLGCGPDQVAALNPRAVYCSITAFGRTGERAPLPAHDLNVQALAGACHLARDASGRPHGMPLPIADLSASMAAVSSICAALLARERDGRGRALDVGMLDAILSWTVLWSRGVDFAGEVRRRAPPRPDVRWSAGWRSAWTANACTPCPTTTCSAVGTGAGSRWASSTRTTSGGCCATSSGCRGRAVEDAGPPARGPRAAAADRRAPADRRPRHVARSPRQCRRPGHAGPHARGGVAGRRGARPDGRARRRPRPGPLPDARHPS